MRTGGLLATTAVIAAMAPGAHAQSAPATPPAAAPGLEEIVVTAQRRSENLQKAGLAVSAVTGDTLARQGITDAQALTNVIPAVQIASGAGPYNLFYLRGVGSFNVNPLSDSAISFNVDGIAISRPSSTSGVFYDLDRVEVLKGPQGTLYGRNATGGAINVITRGPKLGELSGSLTGEYGNYNAEKVDGAINLPLGDKAALRAAFLVSDHDAWLSDGTDTDQGRAGRLRFKLEATPDFTIQIGADYYHQGGRSGAVLVRDGFTNARIGNTDPRAQAVYEHTLFFPSGSFLPSIPDDARSNDNYWGFNANLEWRSELGTLTILPAFRRSTVDYRTALPGLHVIENTVSEQSSVEARFASKDTHPLRWLIGGYYLNETAHSALDYNSQFNLSHQRLSLPVESVAGFGRLTWAVTDRFRLTGGVRYTRDKKSLDANGAIANILCFPAFATGNPFACAGAPGFPYSPNPPPEFNAAVASGFPVPYGPTGTVIVAVPVAYNQSRTFTKTTWRAAAEFDIAPRSLLYASAETGFKAGGFFFGNERPSYNPETITAYTIGSKNRFLGNKLQLNLEAFWWKYKDQQISHITRDSAGAVVFATENVGRATIRGVEGELLYAATRLTTVGVNVQYLDAKYDGYRFVELNLGGPPVENCAATPQGATFLVDCSGKRAPQSPEWTLNLSAQQRIPIGAAGDLVLNAATKYQTDIFVGAEYLGSERQSAYWMSNAQLTWNLPGDRYSLAGFVQNIEDAVVKTDAFPHPLVGAALVSSPLRPPRTYGIRASVRF